MNSFYTIFFIIIIIKFFNLDFENSAELIGGSLPAVGQVVAAGAMLDEKLAESAMVMKLARISLIIPVLLILSIIFNKTNNENKFSFNILPWYLYGFVILFLISQIAVFQAPALFLSSLIKPLFVIAMAAIGLSIGFKDLFKIGPKAFGLALFIFAFQIVFLIVV